MFQDKITGEERERDKQTDRQTDRQRQTETERQIESDAEGWGWGGGGEQRKQELKTGRSAFKSINFRGTRILCGRTAVKWGNGAGTGRW